MLTIKIPAGELWDEKHGCFIYTKETELKLEHSLVSISKWESKWHKAFLKKSNKTNEEVIDYIRCMTITQNVDPNVYLCLDEKSLIAIQNYISDPMTASFLNTITNNSEEGPASSETPTSELIYYWMIQFGVPSVYEKWHINRLLTLLKICQVKSQPNGSISKKQLMKSNAEINAMRKAALKTKG